MTTPLDFSQTSPPPLTERALLERLAKRRLQRILRLQIAALCAASLLCALCLLLLAVLLFPLNPFWAALCGGYLSLSALGGALVALFYGPDGKSPQAFIKRM